jgi:phosphopantetheinyl transferase
MPVFFEKDLTPATRLGIWKITEDEPFFKSKVPLHRDVTHPHKRLQHLAGRFLLKYLFEDFPSHLIRIADTRKPFLPDEAFHFSISHCGDYAAAIVSRDHRVGIDIEIPDEKVRRISHKFVNDTERRELKPRTILDFTQIWSAKEAVFKWYGDGNVDFKQHIQLMQCADSTKIMNCFFAKKDIYLQVHTEQFPAICLSYVFTKLL